MKTSTTSSFDTLPDSAFVRESQLVRDCKHPERTGPLPFSAATLWRHVKEGKFPQPVKLSERVTAWQVGDVRAWIASRTDAQSSGPDAKPSPQYGSPAPVRVLDHSPDPLGGLVPYPPPSKHVDRPTHEAPAGPVGVTTAF